MVDPGNKRVNPTHLSPVSITRGVGARGSHIGRPMSARRPIKRPHGLPHPNPPPTPRFLPFVAEPHRDTPREGGGRRTRPRATPPDPPRHRSVRGAPSSPPLNRSVRSVELYPRFDLI
nr:unnamed protein product [Digitaria exilis]